MSSHTLSPHPHWQHALLDHLRRTRRPEVDRHPSAIYQVSTMSALLSGVYDGDMTIAELLTHGDFGLGTFNSLDGEMVVIDGVCFHLQDDGSVHTAALDECTPFAAVTFFTPTVTIPVRAPLPKEEVEALINANLDSGNMIHAIKISGRFASIRTRTVSAQHAPYVPLVQATSSQAEITNNEVTGVLAGYLTPAFEQGVSVAGYHLHFIDDERRHGGHSLDFVLTEGVIELSTSSELHVSLPRTAAFMAAALVTDPKDLAEQIHQAEN
jgi:acetolactate decarboxylase